MLTFTPIPGRTNDEYVHLDGIHIGRVLLYRDGWGFVDTGGRRPHWQRYGSRLAAGRELELRHRQRAGERECRARAQAAWRRAWRTALVSPGVV